MKDTFYSGTLISLNSHDYLTLVSALGHFLKTLKNCDDACREDLTHASSITPIDATIHSFLDDVVAAFAKQESEVTGVSALTTVSLRTYHFEAAASKTFTLPIRKISNSGDINQDYTSLTGE